MLLKIFLLLIPTVYSIDNTRPRIDTKGQLMDVHDGNVIKYNNTYYWYGMGYTNCTLEKGVIPPYNCPGIYLKFGHCGFRTDHAINLYTSPDLENWTFVKNVFPESARPAGIYFRPKVIFNENTEKFVLWINHLPPASSPLASYPNAGLLVATSEFPDGTFQVVTEKANLAVSGGADFNLMVDPNDIYGTAYLVYDAWGNNHIMRIEKLTYDYTDSIKDLTTGEITPSGNEAPILFERQGLYYLIFGHICCFCQQGSGASVWIANHPLGPWNDTKVDINPNHIINGREIKAQTNYVVQVEKENGEVDYLYTGDLWSSAPDGLKSHDIQYWSPPLEFDDSGNIQPMHFVKQFSVDLN